MEKTSTPIENLIQKAEKYGQTSLELYKLKSVAVAADLFSTLVSKFIIAIATAGFLLFINIGLALWLGDLLGKNYYGFFLIAMLQLAVALLLFIYRKLWLKKPASNFIIHKLLNQNQDAK